MTGKFVQPDYASQAQSGSQYPTNIDNATAIFARLANAFHASEQDVPDMTVRVDAGFVFKGTTLTEKVAQNSGVITAPGANPRIDRIVVDMTTGVISTITGTENASPTAPAITDNQLPVCQVLLQISSTTIINSMITDERVVLGPRPDEGTWTPTIQDQTNSDGEGQTYNRQTGHYTKIGNRVFVNGDIEINSLGTLTGGDLAKIAGLPFTVTATSEGTGGISCSSGTSLAMTAGETISGAFVATTKRINLLKWSAVTGTANFTIAELSAGGRLVFHGQYIID